MDILKHTQRMTKLTDCFTHTDNHDIFYTDVGSGHLILPGILGTDRRKEKMTFWQFEKMPIQTN